MSVKNALDIIKMFSGCRWNSTRVSPLVRFPNKVPVRVGEESHLQDAPISALPGSKENHETPHNIVGIGHVNGDSKNERLHTDNEIVNIRKALWRGLKEKVKKMIVKETRHNGSLLSDGEGEYLRRCLKTIHRESNKIGRRKRKSKRRNRKKIRHRNGDESEHRHAQVGKLSERGNSSVVDSPETEQTTCPNTEG